MKKNVWFFFSWLVLIACGEDEQTSSSQFQPNSLTQALFKEKSNVLFECVTLSQETVEVEIWTSTNFALDNDYQIFLNNETEPVAIGQLASHSDRTSFTIQWPNKGFNNLIIANSSTAVEDPTECIVSLDGMNTTVWFDDQSNAAIDIILSEDITCAEIDGESTVMFWTNYDPLCGFFSVSLGNSTDQTMTHYYTSVPGCGATGCAYFDGLEKGIYQYRINCNNVEYANGIVEVSGRNQCHKIQIN